MATRARDYYKNLPEELRFRGTDWVVRPIDLKEGRQFIEAHHYAGGASNTAVAVHGLFRYGQGELLGVAWWLPPTEPAARFVSADWRNVLSLSRFVIADCVPKKRGHLHSGPVDQALARALERPADLRRRMAEAYGS